MQAALLVLLTGGMVVVAEVTVQCQQPVVEGGTVLGKGDISRWTGKLCFTPFLVPRTSWPRLLAVGWSLLDGSVQGEWSAGRGWCWWADQHSSAGRASGAPRPRPARTWPAVRPPLAPRPPPAGRFLFGASVSPTFAVLCTGALPFLVFNAKEALNQSCEPRKRTVSAAGWWRRPATGGAECGARSARPAGPAPAPRWSGATRGGGGAGAQSAVGPAAPPPPSPHPHHYWRAGRHSVSTAGWKRGSAGATVPTGTFRHFVQVVKPINTLADKH